MPGNPQQQEKVQQVQQAGVNLCGDQGYTVWGKFGFVESKRQVRSCFFPIATAGKEAADSSDTLRDGDGGHGEIKIRHKRKIVPSAVQPSTERSSDDPAVDHKAVGKVKQIVHRIMKHILPFRDQKKQFGSCEAEYCAPDDQRKDMLISETKLSRTVFSCQVGCDDSQAQHQTIAIDREWANREKFVFHVPMNPSKIDRLVLLLIRTFILMYP